MKNFTSKHNVDAAGTSVAPAAAKLPPVKYEDFSGGYYKGAKGTEVPKNAAQDALDFEITRDNKLRRAPGSTLIETFPARTPTQLILHPDLNSTAELLAIYGPELGIKREGAMAWYNLNLPLNARYHYCLYGGDLIFSNSRDTIFVRHPRENVITALRNLPMGVTMAVIAGRLFIGGAAVSGNFESMGQFWTGSDNYDDTDAENGSGFELMIADTGSGDHIVANRVLGFDMMAVLCRRSIWLGRVTGDPDRPLDFQLRFAGKGCVSEPTAQVVHGGIMYLGDEGVEVFDGNDSTNVSAAINTEILPLDQANLSKYTAMYDHRRGWYYLHTPTNTYIFDLRFKRWYKRGQKVVSSTLFSTQYVQEAWAAAVGSWAAQTLTWADKDVPESDIPDTVFLGDNVTPVRRIEKEDYNSILYYGIAQNAFWMSQIDEAQLQSNKLYTVKAVRATFEADLAVDTTVEFKLNNGKSVGISHLVGTGGVDVTQLKTNQTERAIVAGIYFLTGSPIISAYESDIFPRSEKRKADGRAAIVPVVVPLLTGGDIVSLRRYDSSAMIGKGAFLITGVPTLQWNATLKRYTREGLVNGSIVSERYQSYIEPRAIVDPRYPPTGLVVRLSDTLHLLVTGGPPPWSGICYARMSFGFRANAGAMSSANTNQTPFIGFRLDLLPNSNVANPTWKADYVNWDSSVRRSTDTGITSGTPRHMMVELDGIAQKIRWYIDGVLVDTYSPVANDVGGQPAAGPSEWSVHTEVNVSAGGAPSPTLKASIHLGVGQLITCFYNDA